MAERSKRGIRVCWKSAGTSERNGSAAIKPRILLASIFQFSDEVTGEKLASELKIAASEGRFENEGWHVRQNGSRFWAHVVITT
jgi:hypothetical protein